jgi:hypothetical protein
MGAPIATVKGEYVYSGTGFLSASVALIGGEYVYKGSTKMGGPIDCECQRRLKDERGGSGGVLVIDVASCSI